MEARFAKSVVIVDGEPMVDSQQPLATVPAQTRTMPRHVTFSTPLVTSFAAPSPLEGLTDLEPSELWLPENEVKLAKREARAEGLRTANAMCLGPFRPRSYSGNKRYEHPIGQQFSGGSARTLPTAAAMEASAMQARVRRSSAPPLSLVRAGDMGSASVSTWNQPPSTFAGSGIQHSAPDAAVVTAASAASTAAATDASTCALAASSSELDSHVLPPQAPVCLHASSTASSNALATQGRADALDCYCLPQPVPAAPHPTGVPSLCLQRGSLSQPTVGASDQASGTLCPPAVHAVTAAGAGSRRHSCANPRNPHGLTMSQRVAALQFSLKK